MEQSLFSAGPPSDRAFCVTSFVRKPTRSKYCAQTGFVIARMDHHCVWLNNSVGYGNHRTFTVFLLLQLTATSLFSAMIARALVREIGLDSSACGAVTYLLDRNYFLPTVFCVALCVVSLILIALVAEQGTNMARNITANERINRSRYPWMNNDSGQPFNHYDNGIIRNVLEFWFVPGFQKNYFAEFNMRPGKVSKGDLSVLKDGKGSVGAGGSLSKSNGSKNSPTHSTRNQNVYIDRQKALKRRSIAPKKPLVPSPASPTIQFNDSPMSHESPRSTRSKAHTAFQQCEKRAKRVVSAVTSTIPTTGTGAGAGAGAGLQSPSGDLSTPQTADGEAQSPSDKESVAVCSRLIPQHASAPARLGAKRTRRES
jgi:DHHC palmitoyltransferase